MFSPDSKLYQALTSLSTLVLANLAFVGLLLPVISGGVGKLLLFTVAADYFREGTVSWSKVWRTCRRGWGLATAWWIFDLFFGLAVVWEWTFMSQFAEGFRIVVGAWLILAMFLVGMINVWLWTQLVRRAEAGPVGLQPEETGPVGTESAALVNPEVARESFFAMFIRSIRLGFRHLARTALALGVLAAPVLAAIFIKGLFWTVVGWMLLLGCAFGTYVVILLVGRPLGFVPAIDGEAKFSD